MDVRLIHESTSRSLIEVTRFQERILSRRNVVFVNGQVFFQCQLRTWSEDTCYESEPSNATPDIPWGSLLARALSQENSPYESFRDLIMFYSDREFSYDSDALNAASGLLRMLAARLECATMQGLPELTLDAYLLFYTTREKSKHGRRAQFPSYTWVGWKGRVQWFDHTSYESHVSYDISDPADWVRSHAWISWFKRIADGSAYSITDLPEMNSSRSTYKLKARDRLRRIIPSLQTNFEYAAVTTEASRPTHNYPYPLLEFWTVSIHLKIKASTDPQDAKDSTVAASKFELLDKDAYVCGYVLFDGPPPQLPEESSAIILLSETNYGREDFPLLSESRPLAGGEGDKQEFELSQPSDHEEANKAPRERSPSLQDGVDNGWDYYWIMLIEWDNGVAERRGIGQIYKTAAEYSFLPGPVWKKIILA
jgi:hypothetical protein